LAFSARELKIIPPLARVRMKAWSICFQKGFSCLATDRELENGRAREDVRLPVNCVCPDCVLQFWGKIGEDCKGFGLLRR